MLINNLIMLFIIFLGVLKDKVRYKKNKGEKEKVGDGKRKKNI